MPDVPSSPAVAHRSGIRDNRERGSVGKFLKEKIRSDASLAFVSAYFTIYAWEKLKGPLQETVSLRFLFGEPRFIGSLDPEKSERQSFRIEDDELALANRIEQKRIAADCDLFDRQTRNGTDMAPYSELARKAIASIRQTFARRSVASLLSGRDGKLPKKEDTPGDAEQDYELVTWLVIVEG
jgi:hypothetical protein